MNKPIDKKHLPEKAAAPQLPATPDWADALAAEAGSGLEDVKASDMALPFFKLLQSMSPETKRSEPAYIEGAAEGMWLDSVAREVYDEIIFAPARFATHYIEWKPERGGLVRNHGIDASVLKTCSVDPETGRNITRDGNEVVPTATWFGVVLEASRGKEHFPNLNKRAVLTLSGTQTKVSRKWVSDSASIKLTNSKGEPFTPPLCAMTYRLGALPTKNDRGSWFLATVSRAGWLLDYPNGRHLFDAALEFGKLARDLQPVAIERDDEAAPSSARGPVREVEDTGIPF